MTHGFIVTEFTIWPSRGSTIGDISAVLATKSGGAVLPMNASDNRQIAWGYAAADAQGIPISTVIRPSEIVLEELIIIAEFTGLADGLNYLVKLEPITITDAHSALVLISNKSQDLP